MLQISDDGLTIMALNAGQASPDPGFSTVNEGNLEQERAAREPIDNLVARVSQQIQAETAARSQSHTVVSGPFAGLNIPLSGTAKENLIGTIALQADPSFWIATNGAPQKILPTRAELAAIAYATLEDLEGGQAQ